jgi:hypothetical protein
MFGWESLVIRVPSDNVGEAVASPCRKALRISISDLVSLASEKSLLFLKVFFSFHQLQNGTYHHHLQLCF